MESRQQTAYPPKRRPILLYDGECTFCCRWMRRWQVATGDAVAYETFQEAGARFPDISKEAYARTIHLIEPSGAVSCGAEAVFRVLATVPQKCWLYRWYIQFPLWAQASECLYRCVAQHRLFFSFMTRLLWGNNLEPPTYRFSSWLFLRLLGAVFLIAFLSFWVQASGLTGSGGIWPLAEYLEQIATHDREGRLSLSPYLYAPTLFWISASDVALHLLLAGGVIASLLLIVGVGSGAALFALWVLYLSLCTAVPVFLNFQWDTLLLETAFTALLMVPWKWRECYKRLPEPPFVGRLLLWWLLFRLMFTSGVVKLNSGDTSWWDLSALDYHYFTQPLPTWMGWYLAQLPSGFHAVSVVIMFLIELAVPFLIFGPRRLRKIGFGALVLFQVMIALSGNYGFFNLISVVLCVLLIDDQSLPRWLRLPSISACKPQKPFVWGQWLRGSVTSIILVVTSLQCLQAFKLVDLSRWDDSRTLPTGIRTVYASIERFRSLNAYGLFRVMTRKRPEIMIEGSEDGEHWIPYRFRWKPDERLRLPGWMAPHMPRLDWQMWFAALQSDCRYTQGDWFLRFMQALLEGRPSVLALLDENPFPKKPPRYVRVWRDQFEFTDFASRRQTGHWWQSERVGAYCPLLQLGY